MREPATLVLSPMLVKLRERSIFTASRPLTAGKGRCGGRVRGAQPCSAAATAAICAGVVPQQPPAMFSRPAFASSSITEAIFSGVSL